MYYANFIDGQHASCCLLTSMSSKHVLNIALCAYPLIHLTSYFSIITHVSHYLPITHDFKLKSADIVLFHGATHSFSYPDKRDAIFALLSMEQPKYAPILLNPAGLKHFDLLSTYSMEPVYPGTNIPNLPISYYPLNLVSASAVLSPPRPFISKTGFGTGNRLLSFTSIVLRTTMTISFLGQFKRADTPSSVSQRCGSCSLHVKLS